MRILANFPNERVDNASFPVVTLGVFDGVHRGHQRILERTLEQAAGRAVCVVTFDPHPRSVLGPPKEHRLLTPIDERLDLLRQWSPAAVAILRFDARIARLEYDVFVREALLDGLGARHLVFGYNVRIGRDRKGTPESLAALGARLGFEVDLVDAVKVNGEVVSSTAIRHRLDRGEVEGAADLLGRPYRVQGTVVRGRGRGRGLGIATANLALPDNKLVPANGVYAARVHWGGSGAPRLGAVNIGVAPTFADTAERTFEVHILDYEGDLYGERLAVELVRRLRDERTFAGPQALLEQIRADLAAVRDVGAAPLRRGAKGPGGRGLPAAPSAT